MTELLAAVVLAAGEGRRLRPLTTIRPKPLCPVGGVTLLDRMLEHVSSVVPVGPETVAVNAHHLADQVAAAVGRRAHLSVERPVALGTAGAVGALRPWLDGRDVLVANADAHLGSPVDLGGFVRGWDRVRPRLLVVEDRRRPDFDGQWRFVGVSLLPAAMAARLSPTPAGLYEVVWRGADLDLVPADVEAVDVVDCGDPSSYLRANLLASGGASVVGDGAVVDGEIERCVVWPGARVHAGEQLVEVVRAVDGRGRDVTVAAPQ